MTVRKHDYATLEAEYIRGDLSIRALCRKHEIRSFSTVAEYAREHGWEEKRTKIRGRADAKIVERVSGQIAEAETDIISTVRGEWLTVIRAATYKFAEDLKDPSYKIRVDDLIKLIEKGLVLLGEPSDRTEERHLELTGDMGQLGPEFFRRLAERTRSGVDDGRGSISLARVGPPESRDN